MSNKMPQIIKKFKQGDQQYLQPDYNEQQTT